jgi:DNA polymerase/3'-5' exonuclease PolX
MSDASNPIPWMEAALKSAAFVKLIADLGPCYMAGSLRRRKETVNDIEIVTRLPHRAALLARLDRLISNGLLDRAAYQDETDRWGLKYAGVLFRGARIELFNATEENFGYIQWLRTGPADGNEFVMKHLDTWPIRFSEGHAWYATYERGMKQLQYRVAVPDEGTLFKLIGLPCLDPERRTETIYRQLWKARIVPPMPYIESLKISAPMQGGLL